MILAILLLSLSLISTPAFADMVHLKNQNSIEGIIEKEGASSITLDLGYGRITIDKKDISSIVRYNFKEQNALRQRWHAEYFLQPEFIPVYLQELAQGFKNLETLRETAARNKLGTQVAAKKIDSLKEEIEKAKEELAEINAKVASFKPENNLSEYNALIEKSNSLIAKINLNDYNLAALEKEKVALERKISEYLNSLRLFKEDFQHQMKNYSLKQGREQGNYFFQGINKRLAEMDRDFIKHALPYEVRGASIVVEVLLNNLLNTHLILDTGASLVTISSNVAQRLTLKTGNQESSILVRLADGTTVKATPVILESVKVGQTEAKNVKAAILEQKVSEEEDGLLGMSFLENFILRIDLKGNKLVLEEFNP